MSQLGFNCGMMQGWTTRANENEDYASKLRKAVVSCDVTVVRRLVKGGINVKVTGNHNLWYKTSLLHEAVSAGNVEIVKLLLQAKAEVNAVNQDRRSALHLAARSGNLEMVRELIKAGANCDARTSDGRTALHIALWRGKSEVARCLVEFGANVNIYDDDGWTPLYWAVKLNFLEICKLLIQNGAKIDRKVKLQTPLHEALVKGYYDVAKYLIQEGADLDKKMTSNNKSYIWTLLHGAKIEISELINFLDYLKQHGYIFRNDTTVRKANEYIPKRFLNDEKFQMWLENAETYVNSLSCICRKSIRNHLSSLNDGQSLHPIINQLPLPKLVIQYLSFRNYSDSEPGIT